MNLKLTDLFEIKYIGSQNIEDRKIIEKIEVHNILNLNKNIRQQFQLIISTFHKNLICVHIFKKYFTRDKIWSTSRIQYVNSFCLSKLVKGEYDWKDLEKYDIPDDYFMIDESYDRSILSDDYDFFIDLKNHFRNFTPEISDELQDKLWGKSYNVNSIKWQVILGNNMTMVYGSGIDETNFRCKDFSCDDLKKIYYPDYKQDSIVYKKFVDPKIVNCDSCLDNFRIDSGKMYNHYNYGDMCKICFQEKKKKEEYRKEYFKKFFLVIGRRSIFKKNLEITKEYLKKNGIKELSNGDKYILMKKFNENIVKKRKVMECAICLEEMTEDIYAGSCGHCIHGSCYFLMEGNKCPLCRKIGIFKKLHL